MHQPDHAEGDGHRDARSHQGTLPRRQLDVFCAKEIDTGIPIMSAAGQREPGIEADNFDFGSQTGRHGATDYP